MTESSFPRSDPTEESRPGERRRWVVALMECDRQAVIALADRLAARYNAAPASVPEAGLGLLTLRDSVFGDPFHAGELTLSVATVSLAGPTGQSYRGAACIMRNDAGLAFRLAVCEGVLVHRLEGWQEVARLVEQGLEKLHRRNDHRRQLRAATRVDFSRLEQES